VFVAVITIVNFMRWLFRSLYWPGHVPCNNNYSSSNNNKYYNYYYYWPGHVQYLRKQLRAFDATQREAGILAKFAENYLRRDGMFIVRLVGLNMGEVVAGEIVCGLWNNYSLERRSIAEKSGRKSAAKAAARGGVAGGRMEIV